MQCWQRGTSIAMTTTAYLADRWQGYRSAGGATASRQVTGDTTNLPFIQYCMRVQRDSGNTSTNSVNVAQSFETINSIPFTGKTVTFSFYARAGANFSPTSNNLNVYLATGTGTDQNVIAGFTGNSYIVNTTAALTTTWVRYTYTATVGATATQLAPYFAYSPTGTAGANDYFEITGVQIDIGSVALPFRTYAGTIQGELAACQRYYFRAQSTSGYKVLATGFATSTGELRSSVQLPVQMRTIPTLTETSAMATFYWEGAPGGGTTPTNIVTTTLITENLATVSVTKTATFTSGAVYLLFSNNTAAFLGFGAEL
jgi:hypothetical protein